MREIELSDSTRVVTADTLRFETHGDLVLAIAPSTGGYVVTRNTDVITLLRSCEGERMTLAVLLKHWSADEDSFTDTVVELFERGMLALDGYVYGTSSSTCDRTHPSELTVVRPRTEGNIYPILTVFHVHNYCNLACRYCYSMEEETSPRGISFDLMRRAIDQCVALPTSHMTYEFHGGEPTMAFETISQVVKYANEVYALAGKSVSYAIQTNACSLTDEVVEFLRIHRFSVRVSLDGTRQINDQFRRTHSGEGSYDRIVAGICMLQRAGIAVHAVCVVHHHNVGNMVEMYDAMALLGVASIRFLPVFKSGSAGEAEWVDGNTYFKDYFQVIRHIVSRAKSGMSVCPMPNLIAGELGSLTSLKREYMCMRDPCGAGTHMVAIDIDGGLFPCEEMIGKPYFQIGNVMEDDLTACLKKHPVIRRLKSRHVDAISACKSCTWRQMCHGGCIHKSYTHFERLDRESEYCSYYKQIYRELIWLEQEQPGAWKILRGS